MLTPYENSMIIKLTFSYETLCTDSMPLNVETADSSGFVTIVSIFSGLAPGKEVYITTYGKSIFGRRSVVMFVNDITPRIMTRMTIIITVSGLFTL